MGVEPNLFEKFTELMDQNIRGVQYGVYSVAVFGLAYALKSVKPFKKISRPIDFPSSFIEKRIKLYGKALGVVPPCGSSPLLLLIDHTPIIPMKWMRLQTPDLPVEISSIDVSPLGLSWLQHTIVGMPVEFIALKVNEEYVTCIVKKKRNNIGVDLVSLGFATVTALDFKLEKDPLYINYYRKLLSAENCAEKKGRGVWQGEKSSFVKRLLNKASFHIYNSPPHIVSKLKNAFLGGKDKSSQTASTRSM